MGSGTFWQLYIKPVRAAEKENQTFMLRMIRWASVNLKLKTEWNYYSYLAKISVKLLISAENVSYNPNSAEISVKLLISAENVSYNPNSAEISVKQLVSV